MLRALHALGGWVVHFFIDEADEVRRCPICRGHAPCPMQWEPADDDHWWIRLRCGECGHWYETTISNERAKRFDAELDADARAMRRPLERLDWERMAHDVEVFVAALRSDAIGPDDFVVSRTHP